MASGSNGGNKAARIKAHRESKTKKTPAKKRTPKRKK